MDDGRGLVDLLAVEDDCVAVAEYDEFGELGGELGFELKGSRLRGEDLI